MFEFGDQTPRICARVRVCVLCCLFAWLLQQPQEVVENIKKEQVVDHKRAFCRVEEVPPTQKQSARSSSPRPTGFDVVVEDEYELTETDSQSGELHGVFVVDCVQLSSNVFRLS